MARDLWTRDEMILVLNLYLKLPFGKMDRRNPDVIQFVNVAKVGNNYIEVNYEVEEEYNGLTKNAVHRRL